MLLLLNKGYVDLLHFVRVFAAMHELDGDSMGLSADGRYAVRDVVQFVAMRDFLNPNAPWEHTKARLAKEVLAEIPNQLVSYMMKHSFMPRNKVAQPVFPGVPPPGHSAPSGPSAPPFFPS